MFRQRDVSLDAYDDLRLHPIWFVVVAGHEDDRSNERVVGAEHCYMIVEKIGIAGEAARLQATDSGSG